MRYRHGTIVRLRTPDGISFTKADALKAAYFIDVEVKRILAERPATPTTPPGTLAAAPERSPNGLLASPVSGSLRSITTSFGADQLRSTKSGRADDFSWHGGQ
jgi:hypothetical protein